MINPIRWLFKDPELRRAEEELDAYIERIVNRVSSDNDSILIEINVDFPKSFTRQSEEIARGEVEWKDFYSNKSLQMYSLHCKMQRGSVLKEHRHPQFDEYIYVISGSIVNLVDSYSRGSVIVPPESVEGKNDREGWYRIPAGTDHIIQAIEDHTHFISKFLKPDAC